MASIAPADEVQRQHTSTEDDEKHAGDVHARGLPIPEPRDTTDILANPEAMGNTADVKAVSKDGGRRRPDKPMFRPLALQPWFLNVAIGFNLAVISLLIALFNKPRFELMNEWAYFVVQILPTVIGTITTASLEAIVSALSRITPFMRCARPEGDTADTSIMLPYVPQLDIFDSISSGNWHLFVSGVILFLSYPVLGLKAALLSASIEDGVAQVTGWTLYALLGAYVLITLFIAGVALYLHNRPTGLRKGWDTVNLADHLVLFRHSNFLDSFEGSCIATRKSMKELLGKTRLKLDYWSHDGDEDRDEDLWYGFKEVDQESQVTATTNNNDNDPEFSVEELSRLRFNSAFTAMKPLHVILFMVISAVILAGYIIALALGASQWPDRNTFHLSIPPAASVFLFQFFLTSIVALYSLFWEDMHIFAAITEPYAAMGNPKGATADEALLLNYTCSPRPITMFDAAARGHWLVFSTALFAILQRLLPIVVGASITTWGSDSDASISTIQFSTPLSCVTIVYLFVYILAIPWIAFISGYKRHMPRDSITISDLLSWACSSHVLRQDAVDLDPDRPETGLLAGNPLDTGSEQPRDEKWYMEARLRLAQQRFSFGPETVPGKDQLYSIGIKTFDAATPRLHRPSRGLRRRVAAMRGGDEETGPGDEATRFKIAGAGRFTVVNSGENNSDVSGMGGPLFVENAARLNAQQEGENGGQENGDSH